MPNWTNEQFIEWQRKRTTPLPSREPCPIIQELKTPDTREAGDKPTQSEVDEGVHKKFRIAITLLVSDKRERDGDGAEATLLDCLVRARKRLQALPDSMLVALYRSIKGPGGGESGH